MFRSSFLSSFIGIRTDEPQNSLVDLTLPGGLPTDPIEIRDDVVDQGPNIDLTETIVPTNNQDNDVNNPIVIDD